MDNWPPGVLHHLLPVLQLQAWPRNKLVLSGSDKSFMVQISNFGTIFFLFLFLFFIYFFFFFIVSHYQFLQWYFFLTSD